MSQIFNVQLTSAVTIVGATETIVFTSPAISTRTSDDQVSIAGSFDIIDGTSTVSTLVKCRRGTTVTGTQIGLTNTITSTGGSEYPFPFDFVDTPGNVAGLQYVVTATSQSATANGSVPSGSLQITVGS